MKTLPLPQIVGDFFNDRALQGTCGIVALSGGPDSVCLARVLRDLQKTKTFSQVILAHLNHQLRGEESVADEAFVKELAQRWKMPCRTQWTDVAGAAKATGANLEEMARKVRYNWLQQIAQKEGASWVAMGHNADDQAETILFRMLRGSGLQGLAGMSDRRPLAPGIDLVRPLLHVDRAAILAFLNQHKQRFREDSSNDDERFTRNRLRHELLPHLAEKYNPAIRDVLCRLGEQARDVQEEIVLEAGRLLLTVELPRAGEMIVFDVGPLKTTLPHMRREVFRLVWQRELWSQSKMSFDAWDRLANLVDNDGGSLDLPAGVKASNVGRVIQLSRNPV